jgi:hypothetical protein
MIVPLYQELSGQVQFSMLSKGALRKRIVGKIRDIGGIREIGDIEEIGGALIKILSQFSMFNPLRKVAKAKIATKTLNLQISPKMIIK